jgi:hypothetical protein
MKIKKVGFEITQELNLEFRIIKITSWFGVEWSYEFVGKSFKELLDAKLYLELLTTNKKIKLF